MERGDGGVSVNTAIIALPPPPNVRSMPRRGGGKGKGGFDARVAGQERWGRLKLFALAWEGREGGREKEKEEK